MFDIDERQDESVGQPSRNGQKKSLFRGCNIFVIAPLVFVIVGGLISFFLGREAVRARTCVNWPTVTGQVIASSVQELKKQGEQPLITYRYAVDGVSFEGDNITYGRLKASPEEYTERYVRGKEIQVHYLPRNPSVSVLEPGGSNLQWLIACFGFGFALMGIFFSLISYKMTIDVMDAKDDGREYSHKNFGPKRAGQ